MEKKIIFCVFISTRCVVLDVMHVSNIGWGILPDKR